MRTSFRWIGAIDVQVAEPHTASRTCLDECRHAMTEAARHSILRKSAPPSFGVLFEAGPSTADISMSELQSLYPAAAGAAGLKIRYRSVIFDATRLTRHIPGEGSVLDIGCGAGLLLSELSLRGHSGEMSGVDMAATPITLAQAASVNLGRLGKTAPHFRTVTSTEEWPPGLFDIVCMVDVVHHVPPALQDAFVAKAAAKVSPGGLMVYKDMADTPWWCGLGNRVHDKVFSGESINYFPLSRARTVLRDTGLNIIREDGWRQLWYQHECLMARRSV